MLKDLYKTKIMRTTLDTSIENTREFEELKNMLSLAQTARTIIGRSRRQYKLFWFSWDSCNNERNHEVRRLQNDKLGTCCFIDLIGRPKKGNQEMPMLPYQ